jgi:hypothetical protein
LADEESGIKMEGFDHKAHQITRLIFLGSVIIIGILLSILSENLSMGPSWIVQS